MSELPRATDLLHGVGWVVALVLVWVALAVPVALLLGRAARSLAHHRPAPPRLVPPLNHDWSHG